MEKSRLKGLFHVSDTREGGDYILGSVVRLQISCKILVANLRKAILDRKHFNFHVQVICRGHLNAACGYAQGIVFESLKYLLASRS